MSETQLQKDIMKAVHKVNKMNINLGQSQYMGRGEDSSEEVEEVAIQQPDDQRGNIYDEEESNSLQAAKDIMKDIKARVDSVNLGQTQTTKLIKKLHKINDMLGSAAVGGESELKSKIKHLKEVDPKLYYKLKAKLDIKPKAKKAKKPKGGAKRPQSEKQKEWQAFVKELSQKEKYKGMKRADLMKIASEKYKKKQ